MLKNLSGILICCIDNKESADKIGISGNTTPNTGETQMPVTSRMTKTEIKKHARFTVSEMLGGRCQPESEDVYDVDDEQDKELVMEEIRKVLDRLRKMV